ncbi:MAG: hypothetical protein NXY57DRAFT_1041524 [Lentinula lateritia]|nr:MAG: hypothetical protein NXY57DRAFT_1041524 [Lentinula lateritia]
MHMTRCDNRVTTPEILPLFGLAAFKCCSSIINAACENGHTWSQCSITTFILSTAHVRTCIGCTQKAFLPPVLEFREDGEDREEGGGGEHAEHQGLGQEEEKKLFPKPNSLLPNSVSDSWFVEELLEAVLVGFQVTFITLFLGKLGGLLALGEMTSFQ